MSATIDERVVQMSFDNKEFERNVQTSMSTIEKLKQSLNLEGASRGLENVSSAARNVDMSGISSAVETVKLKFSAMEVAAITALSNIVNSAVNAGKRMVAAFTTDPITTGFQEYETQMNAVQTILANTSGAQTEVSKEAIQAINDNANASMTSTVEASKAAVKVLKDVHDDALDAFQDAADEQMDELRKSQKQELKSYQKTADAEIKTLQKAQKQELEDHQKTIDAKLDAFDDAAEEELDALEDKYDKESAALSKAIKQELTAFKNAHKEKLALYEEEYLEKLKVTDEERYNKIKAIDEEIASLKGLIDAEEESNKQAERSWMLADLQSRIDNAIGIEERIKAETALANYKEKIAQEDLLKEREAKIEVLEASKDAVNEEYDLIEDQIKSEYQKKKESANELYNVELENLKEEQSERQKALRETYNTERELLRDQQNAQREALRASLADEKEAILERHELEKEALKDQQELEKEALQEQHDAEEKALKKQQKAEKKALLEIQEAELAAMDANLKVALENIDIEKSAQIRALSEVKDATNSVKATTLDDVNAALDELNEYADKTIYNFTEMTRNIGTFTAAGVDLDTSVAAIKGIANLAAVSGSSSQQASTAMYQLSQAISSGTVRLMDWNSVQNAGMGGKVFQNALLETARVHGIAVDEMIAENGSFRDSLQKGWLSSDILLETLKKFTGDLTEAELEAMGYNEEQIKGIIELGKTASDAATKVKTFTQLMDTLKEASRSGWSQTWRILIGDFEEAKALWTEVSDVFGGFITESAEQRNKMLQGWKDLGGRTILIDAIKHAFEGLVSVVKPIKDAFREIFPHTTSIELYNMTAALHNFTEKLTLSDTQSENLKQTFKGLFAVLDIVRMAFVAIWDAVKPLLGGTGTLLDNVLNLTGGFGSWLVNLRDTIEETDVFGKALQKVSDVVKEVIGVVVTMKDKVVDAVKSMGDSIANSSIVQSLSNFWNGVGDSANSAGGYLVEGFIKGIKDKAIAIKDSVVSVISDAVIAILDFLGINSPSRLFMEIGGYAGEGLIIGLNNTASKIGEAAKDLGATAVAGITSALSTISDTIANSKFGQFLSGVWTKIKEVVSAIGEVLGSFASNVGEDIKNADLYTLLDFIKALAAGSLAISVSKSVGGIAEILDNIGDILNKVKGCFQAYQNDLNSEALLKIAGAVAILVASIAVISLIDPTAVSNSLGTVTMVLAELVGAIAIFSKVSGSLTKVASASVALVGISVALLLFTSVMNKLSGMSSDDLVTGLMGIAALSSMLVITAKSLSSASGSMIKASAGILVFSIALGALVPVIALLGVLPLDIVSQGLIAMGVALGALAIALNLVKNVGVTGATALLITSTALTALIPALVTFGALPTPMIKKGLITIAAALAIFAVGLNVIKTAGIKGAASLVVVAASLLVLAPALAILGSLPLKTIGVALLALVGVFAVFGVAALVLAPLAPVMISLATGLALVGVAAVGIGAGLLAAGLGLSALAVGFAELAVVGTAGAVVLAGAIAIVVTGIVGAIGMIALELGKGLITFVQAIANAAPQAKAAFMTILQSIIETIVESVPLIVSGVLSMLSSILTSLAEYLPTILEAVTSILTSVINAIVEFVPVLGQAALDLLVGCLKVLADNIPLVISTATDLLVNFLKGIADNIQRVVETAADIVVNFVKGISEKLPDIIQAGFDLLISFLQGITNAINNNKETLAETMKELILALVGAAIEVLKSAVDLVWEAGKALIDSGLIQGIWEKLGALKDKIGELISAAVKKITEKLSEWTQAGKDLIAKVISGIGQKLTDIKTEVGNLISNAKSAITDKFEEWKSIGKDLIQGFIGGIKQKAQDIKDAALGVIEGAVDKIKSFLGINSPSRLFMEIGEYSDEGLAIGLKDGARGVTNAAEDVAHGAVDAMSTALAGVSDLLNSDMDTSPTIRPVLDMSDIEAGANRINALFSREQAMSISSNMNRLDGDGIQNGGKSMSGATYQFTQNNYSPKALSRVEIYRQTRNQFSALERMATP